MAPLELPITLHMARPCRCQAYLPLMCTPLAILQSTNCSAFDPSYALTAGHDAGPDPVRAMAYIHHLHLFPAVFTVTPDAEAKLPSNWGEPCVQLVTLATATLAAVNFQVSFFA